MSQKISKLFFVILISVFSFFNFLVNNANAIDNSCKNPSLYEFTTSLSPTRGDHQTPVVLGATFRWTTDIKPICLNTKLRFDVSYKIAGPGASSVTSPSQLDINQGEYSIGKVPFGQTGQKNWNITLSQLDIPSRYQFTNGDTFAFNIKVEDDDAPGLGDDFTPVISKTYTVVLTNKLCAYIDPGDGKWACISGSESKTDCSSVSQCSGKSCQRVEASLCGTVATQTHKACRGTICVVISGAGADECTNNAKCASGGGTTTTTQKFEIRNPIGVDNFQDLVNIIGRWIFNLAIPIAVIIIIYAGVLMLISGGNPAQFQKGAKALWYAVIGLAVVLIGKGFITLIQSILSLRNP